MKQNTFNWVLLGLAFIAEKIKPSQRDFRCKCDPTKFLENEDCPIHLKAKTPLKFDGDPCVTCGGERDIHPAMGACSKCFNHLIRQS